MKSFDTPILLLVFNRPGPTAAVVERLRQIRPKKLYLHADGPRPERPGEAEKVAAVRAELAKIDWPCEIKRLFRDQNMGLKAGVFDALNWFFREEAQGIVLEDDNQPDPTFFPFCQTLLEQYAENEQVMHIGGLNLAEEETAGLASSFVFSKFALVWGWASWRRAWEKMRLDFEGLDEFLAPPSPKATAGKAGKTGIAQLCPDSLAQAYMADKFLTTRAGKTNSWAYAWQYSVLKNKGLCIVPRVNLVQNVGVGEADATNTSSKNLAAVRPARAIEFPLHAPETQVPDGRLEAKFFYAHQKNRLALWRWHLLKFFSFR